jgi:hypothetical protein
MKISSFLLLICLPVLALAQPAQSSHSAPQDLSANGEPPILGVHWARGLQPDTRAREAAKSAIGGKKNPDMTYHGGKILPSTVTQAIFWGTGWAGDSGDKMAGIDAWYDGFHDSNYAKTSDEYTGSNGQVGSGSRYDGSVIDTSPAAGGNSTSAILAEVCKAIPNPDPSGNGYYAVYSDVRRGHANYCAYHSYGACGGKPVQFAFFFNLDGDAGCDPQDTSGLHSQGLAALANVSGHELSEARTDPASPGAWYDSKGEENGDKCAWTFNAPLVAFSNGTQWKIQGEWSNHAFDKGTGYANSSGDKGCIDGEPVNASR